MLHRSTFNISFSLQVFHSDRISSWGPASPLDRPYLIFAASFSFRLNIPLWSLHRPLHTSLIQPFTHPCTHPSIESMHPSILPSIYPSVFPSILRLIRWSIHPSTQPALGSSFTHSCILAPTLASPDLCMQRPIAPYVMGGGWEL